MEVAAAPSRAAPVRRGDVAGLMRRLTADFKQVRRPVGVGALVTGGEGTRVGHLHRACVVCAGLRG